MKITWKIKRSTPILVSFWHDEGHMFTLSTSNVALPKESAAQKALRHHLHGLSSAGNGRHEVAGTGAGSAAGGIHHSHAWRVRPTCRNLRPWDPWDPWDPWCASFENGIIGNFESSSRSLAREIPLNHHRSGKSSTWQHSVCSPGWRPATVLRWQPADTACNWAHKFYKPLKKEWKHVAI